MTLLEGKELLLIGGDEEEACRGVVREERDVGVEEPCLVEPREANGRPAHCRLEAHRGVNQVNDEMDVCI